MIVSSGGEAEVRASLNSVVLYDNSDASECDARLVCQSPPRKVTDVVVRDEGVARLERPPSATAHHNTSQTSPGDHGIGDSVRTPK